LDSMGGRMNPIEKEQVFNRLYNRLNLDCIEKTLLLEAIGLKQELEEESIQYQMECEWIEERENSEITDKDISDMNDYYNKEIYK